MAKLGFGSGSWNRSGAGYVPDPLEVTAGFGYGKGSALTPMRKNYGFFLQVGCLSIFI
jgi:hypothetical protein